VRKIRDRCIAQSVPFFFKQWGGTKKKLTGRELDGRTWDEMPEIDSKISKLILG
jgi:protein gp37